MVPTAVASESFIGCLSIPLWIKQVLFCLFGKHPNTKTFFWNYEYCIVNIELVVVEDSLWTIGTSSFLLKPPAFQKMIPKLKKLYCLYLSYTPNEKFHIAKMHLQVLVETGREIFWNSWQGYHTPRTCSVHVSRIKFDKWETWSVLTQLVNKLVRKAKCFIRFGGKMIFANFLFAAWSFWSVTEWMLWLVAVHILSGGLSFLLQICSRMVRAPSWCLLRAPTFTEEVFLDRAECSWHFGVTLTSSLRSHWETLLGPVCTERLSGVRGEWTQICTHLCTWASELCGAGNTARVFSGFWSARCRSDLETVGDTLCHVIWVMLGVAVV